MVLAAVLLLGTTVSASEYFHFNEHFLSFFGISDESDQEKLKSLAVDPEKNENTSQKNLAEHQGVTICASQAVSDGEVVYIYFDITLPEGAFPESDDEKTRIVRFRENSYSIGQTQDAAVGGMVIEKNEDTPNQYYAIGEMEMEDVGEGSRELSMTFGNLGYIEADDISTEWVDMIQGEWILSWNLEYRDGAQNYSVSKTFTVGSSIVEIQNVRLSPFSIKLTGVTADPESLPYDQIFIDGMILEDGSCQDLFKVECIDPEDEKVVMGGTFRNMVDTDMVKGIRINGEDIFSINILETKLKHKNKCNY